MSEVADLTEIMEDVKTETGPRHGHHLIAGALAGVAEHVGMFPVDTIKTHIQSYHNVVPQGAAGGSKLLVSQSMRAVGESIIQQRGMAGLFNGITAIASGAAPAHAVYFASYELFKDALGGNAPGHHSLVYSSAGMMATALSDLIFVPMDTVKQRMQLGRREYRGTMDCIRKVYQTEGLGRFYSGYTTTLAMNLPYNAVYFAAYEGAKASLAFATRLDETDTVVHLASGGFAGVLASGLTNPLDVARTRLQTQGDTGRTYKGLVDVLRVTHAEEGLGGLLAGIRPRMLVHSMSGAVCWATYEWVKRWLDQTWPLQ